MADIYNTRSNTLLSGTSENDSIRNGGWFNGSGIPNGGSNVTIFGGAGKDYIISYNSAANATISEYVTISGDTDDDDIDNRSDNSSISGGEGNDTIWNLGDNVTINGGSGNDTIWNNGGSNVTVDAGSGNDTINNGYSSKMSISGNSGNDSIKNHGRDVTISGGKGNDTIYNEYENYYGQNVLFEYNPGDGNDLIQGFNETSTLSIGGGSYSTAVSGDNVIITVGKGKISLMGTASFNKININGVKVNPTTKTVSNSTKSPVTVSSTIKTINASSRSKAVKITGNSLANTITGGSGKDTIYGGKGNDCLTGGAGNDRLYGQKGNDTLWGGKGNDSLWGGSGNDTFIYKAGEGTDKIFDYQSGDMLKILKSNGKSGGKFSKSKYSNGTLSLTISGGGQVIFDDVSTSTNFNINGTSYKISNFKLVKK